LSSADVTLLSLDLLELRVPFCLATVVAAGLESGARAGEKLLIQLDGSTAGSVGGARLGEALVRLAQEQLSTGEIRLVEVRADGTVAGQRRARRVGDVAPDTAEVVLEPMLPPDHLIIVGAGHIAQPLAALAHVLGWEVTVIDDRERFANRERFPHARAVVVDEFDRAIAAQQITPWTYLVLVTRGHEHDENTLRQVVGSPAPYIGMIGSRRRVLVVFERLRALGVPEEFLKRVYAPIGLDIGSRTPEEIALAILAEMVNVKRKGQAQSLRDLLPKGAVQSGAGAGV
jgi:xanthine dehydrogenase accessory factor